jgi:gamma-glutamylcyclotransferase
MARVPPGQLYFAYGSNLQLQQMANRCPNSYYIGRAVLVDYVWQINERGFANVIPRSGYVVHGLVYSLGHGDEAHLDRSEGVSKGAYAKAYKSVVVHTSPAALRQPTRWLVEEGGPKQALENAHVSLASTSRQRIEDNVLVYLSKTYVTNSSPRDEYIDRMNLGLRDAVTLGVPKDFVDSFIRRFIPPRQPARSSLRRNRSQGTAAASQSRDARVRRRSFHTSASRARSSDAYDRVERDDGGEPYIVREVHPSDRRDTFRLRDNGVFRMVFR